MQCPFLGPSSLCAIPTPPPSPSSLACGGSASASTTLNPALFARKPAPWRRLPSVGSVGRLVYTENAGYEQRNWWVAFRPPKWFARGSGSQIRRASGPACPLNRQTTRTRTTFACFSTNCHGLPRQATGACPFARLRSAQLPAARVDVDHSKGPNRAPPRRRLVRGGSVLCLPANHRRRAVA